MYGLAFVRTGRVWMPLGLHMAWNYVQGPVCGFPVSGLTAFPFDAELVRQHAIAHATKLAALLTGGAYGPEGGWLGIIARVAVIGAILYVTRQIQPARSPDDRMI